MNISGRALAGGTAHYRLVNEGLEPAGDSPQSFVGTIGAGIVRWAAIAHDHTAQPN
jgi:hypothetical protein